MPTGLGPQCSTPPVIPLRQDVRTTSDIFVSALLALPFWEEFFDSRTARHGFTIDAGTCVNTKSPTVGGVLTEAKTPPTRSAPTAKAQICADWGRDSRSPTYDATSIREMGAPVSIRARRALDAWAV